MAHVSGAIYTFSTYRCRECYGTFPRCEIHVQSSSKSQYVGCKVLSSTAQFI
jgi:hypothetical protein